MRLSPCPDCGEKDRILIDAADDEPDRIEIICEICGASVIGDNFEDAIDQWIRAGQRGGKQ